MARLGKFCISPEIGTCADLLIDWPSTANNGDAAASTGGLSARA
jgi:hypothetical protein